MTHFNFTPSTDKATARQQILDFLASRKMVPIKEDFQKPWGGYFCIADSDLELFRQEFFPEQLDLKDSSLPLSPKILLVAPKARLSWQYHFRRGEIWKVLFGPVGVVQSTTDEQTTEKLYDSDQIIEHEKEIRHRLVGADNWGVVAEIWKHTDPQNLSNEEDIVRLQDDYGR